MAFFPILYFYVLPFSIFLQAQPQVLLYFVVIELGPWMLSICPVSAKQEVNSFLISVLVCL